MLSSWNGCIWIGLRGSAYFIGGYGDSSPHAHHLVQIVVAMEGDVAIVDAHGRAHISHGFIIPSNTPHKIEENHANGRGESFTLFMESFSLFGKHLSDRAGEFSRAIQEIDREKIDSIRNLVWGQCRSGYDLVENVVSTLACGGVRARPMDRRIALAINHIERNFDDSDVFERIADTLGISLRYLRKIFERETGMTMQRFRLWSKMKKAIDHALSGDTLTNASAFGGFSDCAHFSRTFRDMFGTSPSNVFEKLSKPPGMRAERMLDTGTLLAENPLSRSSRRAA